MDNQLVQPKVWQYHRTLITLSLILMLGIGLLGFYWHHNFPVDPYFKEVLSLEGSMERGYAIFQINCAGCHGLKADGSVGPSLKNIPKRKSKVDLIQQVTSGKTPPMPKFQASPQEMADLLVYLEQL